MSEKNTAKFFVFNAVYSYIGKAISSVCIALSFVLIVKNLSIADYGKYTFYINAVFFITLLLDFGMTEVILRYVPQYIEEKNIPAVKWILKKAVFLISAISSIVILTSIIFMFFFPALTVRFHLKAVLPYIILFGWMRISMLMLGNVLSALLLQSYRIACEIIISTARLIFIYLLLRRGADAWLLIVLYGVFDFLLMLIFWFKITKLFKAVVVKAKPKVSSRMFWFGMNEYLYRLFWFFTDNRFDIFIVGYILGLTAAGYLAFAAGIVNLLIDWSPGLIIRPVVAPLFIQLYSAKKDIAQIQYLFKLHNKFLMFITLPILLSIAILFDKAIIHIFSREYLPSLNVFYICTVSMFLINILIPLRNIIAIMERSDISNFTNIVAIPKTILILLFAKSTGLIGVASFYALSYVGIILINIWLINKEIQLSFPWKGFFKIALNSGVMALALFFLKPVVANKISLSFVFAGGIAVYLFAAYFNKVFDSNERNLFNRAFKVRVWCF